MIIPFFAFRIMVGCGLLMLLLAWVGSYLSVKGRIEQNRPLLWAIFLSFPLPFIAILTGWFTAEVGRQPWTVYGVLRTADSVTPFLTARAATISLIVFCAVYAFIFTFGVFYIHQLLRAGPSGGPGSSARCRGSQSSDVRGRRADHGEFGAQSGRENSRGDFLGVRLGRQRIVLRSARRVRSRRRHLLWLHAQRIEAARDARCCRAACGMETKPGLLSLASCFGALFRSSMRLCSPPSISRSSSCSPD